MKYVILMATTKDEKEAAKIAKSLLDKKLAACCNIIPGMKSMFWWEGKQEEIRESLLMAKTSKELAARAAAEIKSLHSYKMPALEFLEIVGGSTDNLNWIKKETDIGLGRL